MNTFFLLISFVTFHTSNCYRCPRPSLFCLGLQSEGGKFQESENCVNDGDCELVVTVDHIVEENVIRFQIEEKQPPTSSDLIFAFSSQKRNNLTDIILFGYKKADRHPQTYIIQGTDPPVIETLTIQYELRDKMYQAMYADVTSDETSEKAQDSQRIRSAKMSSLKQFRTLSGVTSIYHETNGRKVLSFVDFLDTSSPLWIVVATGNQVSWLEIKSENRRGADSRASYRSSSNSILFSSFIKLVSVTMIIFVRLISQK